VNETEKTPKPRFPICALPFSETLAECFSKSVAITPKFPNWEKSFVSGAGSPLFEIEHRSHSDHPGLVISRVRFKPSTEGPPGHVHGGASAALLDETMGAVVWNHEFKAVTQTLSLSYLRTLPLNAVAYVGSEIISSDEKLIQVVATIFDEKKTAHVSAQAVFHRLTQSMIEKFAKFKPGLT
jgi:acyl-coenzyme A thioesterase PaaI-like protein